MPIALNIVRDGTGRDTALTALHKQGWLVDPISVFSKGQTPRKSVAGKQERLYIFWPYRWLVFNRVTRNVTQAKTV